MGGPASVSPAELPAEPGAAARHTYSVLPTRQMQGTGVPWPHDVHIALPPSYDGGEQRYPVLWVTDASLSFALVVGLLNWLHTTQEVGEMIVIRDRCPG